METLTFINDWIGSRPLLHDHLAMVVIASIIALICVRIRSKDASPGSVDSDRKMTKIFLAGALIVFVVSLYNSHSFLHSLEETGLYIVPTIIMYIIGSVMNVVLMVFVLFFNDVSKTSGYKILTTFTAASTIFGITTLLFRFPTEVSFLTTTVLSVLPWGIFSIQFLNDGENFSKTLNETKWLILFSTMVGILFVFLESFLWEMHISLFLFYLIDCIFILLSIHDIRFRTQVYPDT